MRTKQLLTFFIAIFIFAACNSNQSKTEKGDENMNPFFTEYQTPHQVPPFDKMVEKMHEFHFLGIVFAILVVTMLIIGKIMPRKEDFVQEDVKAVDINPWKYAKLTGLILVIIVILIYVKFADFSILAK